MKKVYKKPALFLENFKLMEAVTASCMIPAQHNDKYTCTWYNDDFGMNVYSEFVAAGIISVYYSWLTSDSPMPLDKLTQKAEIAVSDSWNLIIKNS